jgi:dTDP-4-amino-4,6-dideoxygalactose transaminase
LGSSYIPSEIIAAFLSAQLEIAHKLTSERVAAWNYYYERLLQLERRGCIRLAKVPSYCKHNAHIFFILAENPDAAKALSAHLKTREVSAMSHYAPLHTCPMAKQLGCSDRPLPVAEELYRTMLRLPIYSAITPDEQDWVVDSVESFFAK